MEMFDGNKDEAESGTEEAGAGSDSPKKAAVR